MLADKILKGEVVPEEPLVTTEEVTPEDALWSGSFASGLAWGRASTGN